MLATRLTDTVCVSIHDVAPATWTRCKRLIEAMRRVADIPFTLLLVPSYHNKVRIPPDPNYISAIREHWDRGDELALHGYFHQDDGPPPRTLYDRLLRQWYTAGEGEFADLDHLNARNRLEAGLAWFRQNGWQPEGFVPPAWLLGKGAWQALDGLPLRYTTTLRHLFLLPEKYPIASMAFVWSSRSALRRTASHCYNAAALHVANQSSLVRLVLHPADATHPDIVRRCQRLLERLLSERTCMTKGAFANHARSVVLDRSDRVLRPDAVSKRTSGA